jgi:hypothetical protein
MSILTKSNIFKFALSATIGALTTYQAQALEYIIEPDNFTENMAICPIGNGDPAYFGTEIYSTSTDGVLNVDSETPDYSIASTGSRIFAGPGANDWSANEAFIAEFSLPNIFKVSIDMIGSDPATIGRIGTLHAFDASDNELAFMQSGDLAHNQIELLIVTAAVPIAYIVVDVQDPYIALDNLHFYTADAPEALSFLGLGLMGMGFTAYRRKTK